jgi:hypothetical protein
MCRIDDFTDIICSIIQRIKLFSHVLASAGVGAGSGAET